MIILGLCAEVCDIIFNKYYLYQNLLVNMIEKLSILFKYLEMKPIPCFNQCRWVSQ